MKAIKRIVQYALWSIVSLVCALIYLRIILGPIPQPENDLQQALFYTFAYFVLQLWLIIGGVVALIFILTDVFYLRKKIEDKPKKSILRLGVLVSITIIVGIIHYILEKVIDVI